MLAMSLTKYGKWCILLLALLAMALACGGDGTATPRVEPDTVTPDR